MATGRLTALAVERVHREGRTVMLCDGGGLYFRKQTRDGAAWTLRYRFAGRARWMVLGNYPDTSFTDARIQAREKRTMLDKQQDPNNHMIRLQGLGCLPNEIRRIRASAEIRPA